MNILKEISKEILSNSAEMCRRKHVENVSEMCRELDPGIPRVGFSNVFRPGFKFWIFSISDLDSLWKIEYTLVDE